MAEEKPFDETQGKKISKIVIDRGKLCGHRAGSFRA